MNDDSDPPAPNAGPADASARARAIHANTPDVYQQHAAGWDRRRPRTLIEAPWLERFVAGLPARAEILDLGCGAGEPIARYFIDRGYAVTGVDAAPAMIRICRGRYPNARWHVMDMRALALDQRFHGIIGWDSFFHLNAGEQRAVLPRLANHLYDRGALMLTVGPEAGEQLGRVEGMPVYHASLAPDEYRDLLGRAGFQRIELVLDDETCDAHSVLLATHLVRPAAQ